MSICITPSPSVEQFYVTRYKERDPTDSGYDLFLDKVLNIFTGEPIPETDGQYVLEPKTVYILDFGAQVSSVPTNMEIVPRSSICKTALRFVYNKTHNNVESTKLVQSVYNYTNKQFIVHRGERYYQLIRTDLEPPVVKLKVPYTLYVKCTTTEMEVQYRATVDCSATYTYFPLLLRATLVEDKVNMVGTGVQVELATLMGESKPLYLYMNERPGLTLANYRGIIDAGYRGEIKAPIDYKSCAPSELNSFEYVYLRAGDGNPFRVVFVTELSTTKRGAGGFGSTG